MRALAMDFAHDRNVWNIHNQYMFGKSLLVCPVTQPMYTQTISDTIRVEDFSTVKSMRIYLPKIRNGMILDQSETLRRTIYRERYPY